MPQLYCTLKNKRRLHIRPRYRTKHTYVVTRMKLSNSRSLLKGGNLARILGLTAVELLRATAIALPPLSFVRLWQCGAAAAIEACWWPVYMALHILEDTIGDLEPQPRRYIHTLGRFVPHAGYLLYENPLSNWRLLKKRSIFTHFCGLLKKVH